MKLGPGPCEPRGFPERPCRYHHDGGSGDRLRHGRVLEGRADQQLLERHQRRLGRTYHRRCGPRRERIQQKWRVYTNPSQAAQDYLGLLSIKAGMPYLDAGDYYQFVMLIHSMGYFEMDPTEYYSRFAAILPSTKSVLGVL